MMPPTCNASSGTNCITSRGPAAYTAIVLSPSKAGSLVLSHTHSVYSMGKNYSSCKNKFLCLFYHFIHNIVTSTFGHAQILLQVIFFSYQLKNSLLYICIRCNGSICVTIE